MLREPARQDVAQGEQAALIGIEGVEGLELLIQRLVVGAGHRVLAAGLNQDAHEREQKLQVGLGRREAERIDGEARPVEGDPQRLAAEIRREAVVAPAEIEDQGARAVALQMGDQEVEQERFPAPGRPEDQRVADVFDVQVEVVRRPLRGVEHGEGFAAQVRVGLGAGVLCEQEREVGVIRVQQMHRADVVGAVPRQHGQPGVEQVVAFVGHLGVVGGEGLETGADAALERHGIAVVEHDGERVLAEVAALQRELRQGRAQVPHDGRGAVVDEHVGGAGVGVGHVVRETDLGVVEVPTLGVDLAADRPLPFALPFARQDEVRRNLVERLEQERKRVRGGLLEREDADVVVIEAQVRAMTLERGVAGVVVEERVVLEPDAVGLFGRVVQEAPEEGEGLALRAGRAGRRCPRAAARRRRPCGAAGHAGDRGRRPGGRSCARSRTTRGTP